MNMPIAHKPRKPALFRAFDPLGGLLGLLPVNRLHPGLR